jgi:uncharacterized membrane protein YbhN (UPF0104 family)
MKRLLRILQPTIVLAILVAAVWLLYRELTDPRYGEPQDGGQRIEGHEPVVGPRRSAYEVFKEGLADIDGRDIAWAAGLTVLNYVILFGYDYLAIRYLKHPLPARRLMLASFVGNVASLNFGSLLGGTSVRFRFYSLWKFSGLEILQLIVILGITFWLGVCLLAGVVFLTTQFPIPPRVIRYFPAADVRIVGAILIALVLGYLAICALRRRPLKVLKGEVPLPPLWLSLGQIAVSCADLLVVAGVLYVLLPNEAQTRLGYFGTLGVFLLGGIGVFELFNVKLIARKAIASTVFFRAIYLIIPLIVAACLLAGHEVLLNRQFFKRLIGKWRGSPSTVAPLPDLEPDLPDPNDASPVPPEQGDANAAGQGHPLKPESSGDSTAM